MALSHNALRQDRSWWIAFAILAMQSKNATYILDLPDWHGPFVA
jgi:hypothetical protein